ncbi:pyridoxal-phosphate dependent enzyme, partial [bacterium]|nr:pyridoxal-phosphate dependent enzyme [bacterium]
CSKSVNLPCIVFVPAATPQAKLIQMLAYGAFVFRVDCSYDDAFSLATLACEEFGWMNRSAGYNPYLVEGKKTGALELAEQTGFKLPDAVFVSVGDGSIITGLCKGFQELKILGYIQKVPRVFGVQAEGSDVLVKASSLWNGTDKVDFVPNPSAKTIADSICVGEPREGIRALKAVRKTGGEFIRVSDEQIRSAFRKLPLEAGIFGEPAAATAYAGLKESVVNGNLNKKASAAVFITGSGLKDLSTAQETWQTTEDILPAGKESLELVIKRLEENEKR